MDGRIGNDSEGTIHSQLCRYINAAGLQRKGWLASEIGFIPVKVALLRTVSRINAALPPECRKFAPFYPSNPHRPIIPDRFLL